MAFDMFDDDQPYGGLFSNDAPFQNIPNYNNENIQNIRQQASEKAKKSMASIVDNNDCNNEKDEKTEEQNRKKNEKLEKLKHLTQCVNIPTARYDDSIQNLPRHKQNLHHKKKPIKKLNKLKTRDRLDLDFLPVKKLPKNGSIIILGKTKSGKSSTAIGLLRMYRNYFPKIVIFCGSKKTEKRYIAVGIPAIYIHNEMDEKLLEAMYDKQEMDVEAGKFSPLLIIFDDIGFDAKSLKQRILKRLLMNGRNGEILTILLLHDCKSITPPVRSQIDLIFVTRHKNVQDRKRIFEALNCAFDSAKDFDKCLMQSTQERGACLVMDNTENRSTALRDNAWVYRAPFPEEPIDFKLLKQAKSYSNRHYDSLSFLKKYEEKYGKKDVRDVVENQLGKEKTKRKKELKKR